MNSMFVRFMLRESLANIGMISALDRWLNQCMVRKQVIRSSSHYFETPFAMLEKEGLSLFDQVKYLLRGFPSQKGWNWLRALIVLDN